MEKIEKELKGKIIDLTKEIDEYGLLKLKKNILNELVETLKTNKSYKEISDELVFFETRLSLIYKEEDASKYSEILKMLLKGLIKCENDISVYGTHYEDFKNKLSNIIKILENDLENTKSQLHAINITKKRSLLASIKRVLRWIKNNEFTENKLKDVRRVLKQLDYTDDEILLFLEKCNDISVLVSDDITYDDMFNLLNYKFVYFEEINISYDKRSLVNKIYYSVISSLDDLTLTNLSVLVLELEKYPQEVKKCVLEKLLRYFSHKYSENKVLLYDEDFYFSKDFKQEIFNECEKIVEFYEFLMVTYQNINSDIIVDNIPHNTFNNKRKFIFVRNGDVTYFERDLRNLGEEVLQSTSELLSDTLEQSPFVIWKKLAVFDNLYEFKYNNHNNQLRIICRNLGNNVYAIIGLMQKKRMNDIPLYQRYNERILVESRIDEFMKCFSDDLVRIKDYIISNQRKSARK